MICFNEGEKEFKNGDWGTKYFIKGPYWEGGILVFKPGQSLGSHWHQEVEETFYFLTGAPKMIINGVEYRVAPGDVFHLAVGEKHDIINDTAEDMKALFIKSPFKPEDKITVER